MSVKQDQKHQPKQPKGDKKQPYHAPKSQKLGTIQEMTQLVNRGGCGSNIVFRLPE